MEPHLDSSQIDALLRLRPDAKDSSASDQDGEIARLHLKDCEVCQARLRAEEAAMERLSQLRPRKREAATPECPPASAWTELAAGLRHDAESLLSHAEQCDHCGPLLLEAIADLSDEPTPQEEARIAGLASATSQWQKNLAGTLSTVGSQPRPHRYRLWTVSSIAATILVVFSVWALLRHFQSPSPQALIANAYGEHRTLELRIAGAKRAPMQVERGAESSSFDKPASLLRAESLISEQLRKNPNDVGALDAEARADVLDGNFEAAIKTVQRAMESQPLSPVLLTDLATGYFARAEATDQAVDYGRAIDNLSKVIATLPDDSLALFNRAVTEERLFLYDDAVADWEHFLKVEKDPGWFNEGKQRLEELRHRMAQRNHSKAAPIRDPTLAVAALTLRTKSLQETAWPSTLDEAYLNIATTEWIRALRTPRPRSYQGVGDPTSSALTLLSAQLRYAHNDEWLGDLIRGPHTSAWAEGSRELAAAFHADSVGDPGQISAHAAKAIRLFQLAGNPAGQAGARLEYITGLNRSERGLDCLPAATGAVEQVRNRHYRWIEINDLYQLSTCHFLNGRSLPAVAAARQAESLAESAQYPTLQLEGLYYLDGVTTSWLASSESWDQIRAGLRAFWQAPYPASSAAYFYTDLGFAAENAEMWHTAQRVGRESVLMYSLGPDQIRLAAAHHWLAQIAEVEGEGSLADTEYQNASAALANSGTESQAAKVTLEIERAALEVKQGKFRLAAERLERIKPGFKSFSKEYATILYLETLGELHFRFGNAGLAEEEFLAAIHLLEGNKRAVASDADLFSWQRNTSLAYRSMVELYDRKYGDAARSFAFLEWYRAGSFGARRAGPGMEERLPPGTAILTWMSFRSGLAIWLVNSSGVHGSWVDVSQDALKDTVQTFTRLCADPLSDTRQLDKQSRQLYNWLIKPVSAELTGLQTLIVEPDEPLNSIPFQALRSQKGEYLVDRFFVTESPGREYSKALRKNREVSPRSVLLAVGNPLLNATDSLRFRSLADADKEAHNISSKFDRHHLLLGRDATLTHVLQLLPAAEVFHFAGHALSQGREPGLLLPREDTHETALLGRKELRPEKLKSLRLAVLSACDTALADDGLNDAGSLVRPFLRAGVPQVVASKWAVDSSTSAELMEDFYVRLLRGDPVERALMRAERAIRSRPATAHPYYWAAFSAFGGS